MQSEVPGMIGKTNSGIIQGVVNVTCPSSSTVTMTQPGRSYQFTQTGTRTSFKLPNSGAWVITANNGISEVRNVNITPGQTLNVSMLGNVHLFDHNSYASGFTTGWAGRYYNSLTGIWETYNPVNTEAGGVDASTDGYKNIYEATTSGAANLAGYNTVRFGFQVWRENSGFVQVRVVGNDGATVLAESSQITEPTEYMTYDINVQSINVLSKFQIRAETGGSTWAKIRLYDIWLIA